MKHFAWVATFFLVLTFVIATEPSLAAIAEPGWPAPALHLSAVVKGPALE